MDVMPVFTIKAKDALAVKVIGFYHDECDRYGLHEQAAQVDLALDEIVRWQADHPNEVRLPSHKHVPATKETTDHA